MKKAIITLSIICASIFTITNIYKTSFAQTDDNNTNVEVQVVEKLNKEEAEELLKIYNPDVKYIYQGTEKDFVALQEKGLKGYVFLPDIDGDLGIFVNEDNAKLYYFHPSGYLVLANINE